MSGSHRRAVPPAPPGAVAKGWSASFQEECAKSFGHQFVSQRAACRASLVYVLETLTSSEDPDELLRAQFEYWREPLLFNDTQEILGRIDVPVCVVSNIDRSDLEAAIRYHGLSFDHVLTSEDVRSYKPRPELFLQALKVLGVPGNDALHVGDSLSSDVAGATAVGVPVAWLNRTGREHPTEIRPWAEVTSLTELADLLGRS